MTDWLIHNKSLDIQKFLFAVMLNCHAKPFLNHLVSALDHSTLYSTLIGSVS